MGCPNEDRIRNATIEMRTVFGRRHPAIESMALDMFINFGITFANQKSAEERSPLLVKLVEAGAIMAYEADKKSPTNIVAKGFIESFGTTLNLKKGGAL